MPLACPPSRSHVALLSLCVSLRPLCRAEHGEQAADPDYVKRMKRPSAEKAEELGLPALKDDVDVSEVEPSLPPKQTTQYMTASSTKTGQVAAESSASSSFTSQ